MIAFLLFNPELIHIVREETKPSIVENSINYDYLKNHCPRLNSIWMETLRMATSAASTRFLTQDTMIGGKILRKGNKVLIPSRPLHYDDKAFGQDASQFKSERFLKSDAQRSKNWRPFGGGINQCPGRVLAQQHALMFVALLLHRFDIELDH